MLIIADARTAIIYFGFRHYPDARDFVVAGEKRPKCDAEKLVIRLRFGLIQVPVLQYTDINQISSKL